MSTEIEQEVEQLAVCPCARIYLITGQVHHPIDKTSTPQNHCNVKKIKFRNI